MTTPTPTSKDCWEKALDLFKQGQVSAGMAVLALGLDGMAHRAITDEARGRLLRCSHAAAAFAQEWSALADDVAERLELLLATSPAAWVRCPDCTEWFCTIHLTHVTECSCPPVDDWDVDPFTEGRPPLESYGLDERRPS